LAITRQPENRFTYGGESVTFSVFAVGVTPVTYQWRHNGNNLPGQTNSTLVLTNLLPDQRGAYSVVLSNAYTTITSVDAILDVSPLGITRQPQSQSVLAGSNISFRVSVSGVSPIAYQWRFNGMDLPGETKSLLLVTNVLVSQAGLYSAILSNGYATVESSSAVLEVSPFRITTQPESRITFGGATIILNLRADSLAPLSYQWTFNGSNLSGAVAGSLTLSNISYGQAGRYAVVASNAYGTVSSSTATVSVVNFALWGGAGYGTSETYVTNAVGIAAGLVSRCPLEARRIGDRVGRQFIRSGKRSAVAI
jgi:hypothetical protein